MTNMKLINRLLLIASGMLFATGMLFLGISIMSSDKSTWNLALALGSILLGNLFNLIRILLLKGEKTKS